MTVAKPAPPPAAQQPSTDAAADWHRIFESLRDEHDYEVREIEGTLPAQLTGTLYRNGPGIAEVGGKPFAHLFDGHGMISQFTLDGRGVHYRNRAVRTHKFLAERDAEQPQVRGFREQRPGGLPANFLRRPGNGNAANTSVTMHGESLLALWEAGRPWALDPDTLQTLGEYDFEGELKAVHAFSAHPKHDPRTGETFNFGVEYVPRPRIRSYRIDPAGRLHQLGTVPLPMPVMNHDFALTAKHLVYVIDPIVVRVGRLILGASSFDGALRWDASKPTYVLLVPRDGSAPRLLETEPFFHFHVNNAFEEGSDTVIDLVRYEDYAIGERSLRGFRTGGFDEPGTLWRLRVKSDGRIERQELYEKQCEFPQHDWRRSTLPYRYSYLAGREGGLGPHTSILRVEVDSGERRAHDFGEGQVAGEPIFVPRASEGPEDDGWLLTVVYDAREHRSRLVILDAADLEGEPVASAHLTHHIPLGFHGTFTKRVAGLGSWQE
jgi:all-trans-8'-apo-beta-carotenal 15,15'-oxygenase